jgi:hypothetical protein
MQNQRTPSSAYIKAVRPMNRSDIEALRQPSARVVIAKLRDAHHQIARMIAFGMSYKDIAYELGYSYTRIAVLANSPSIVELVTKYRGKVDEKWEAEVEKRNNYIQQVYTKSWRMIGEQLEDADETGEAIPLRTLLAVADSAADRVGITKKSTTVNINVDFAANLERAIARSRAVRQIDVSPDLPD